MEKRENGCKIKHRSVNFQEKSLDERLCRLWKHKKYARYLIDLFDNFKEDILEKNNRDKRLALKLWDARCHGKEKYTCWYVSFLDADTYIDKLGKNKLCIVLHFDITPKNIKIYFRFNEHVIKNMLTGWRKEYVSFNENKNQLLDAILCYLEKVRNHFDAGTLRKFNNFKPSKP